MGIVDFLYNQKITISSSDINGYGDAVLTTKYSNIKCRFQKKTGMITNKNGQEMQYKGSIYLSPDYSVVEGDYINYSGEQYVVIGIESRIDFGGSSDHTQVYIA